MTGTVVRDRLVGNARGGARSCLVVTPAGLGKSTLLSHLKDAAPVPGVHLNAREWDGAVVTSAPSFLAIDDVHLLSDELAARLRALLEAGPPGLTLLLAGRRPPPGNLSRLQASGELVVLGPEDLRFRSWEIEKLFEEVYDTALAPDEAAELARRTGGWAACLHLFHLATAGRPRQRRTMLASLPRGGRLIHEYLTANVLDDLPHELRTFLVRTSVLSTLTPALCDTVRGDGGSRSLLEELDERRLVQRDLGGDRWRCGTVLRAHLQTILRNEVADPDARFLAAGVAAERSGAVEDALEAYVHAGEWGAANRLLATHGGAALDRIDRWVEPPRRGLDDAPWALTAAARRLRAAGRAGEAVAAYERAEAAFGAGAGASVARAERVALTTWLEPLQAPGAGWSGSLRAALDAVPAQAAAWPGTSAADDLGRALFTLVCGDGNAAREQLEGVAADPRASEATAVGAQVALAAALGLAGDPGSRDACASAAEEAEVAGLPWLVDVARAAIALVDPGAETGAGPPDPLGAAIAALFRGLGALRSGADARPHLDVAEELAERLQLRPLVAWACAARALSAVRAGDPAASAAAARAQSAARLVGVRPAHALALLACAEAAGDAAQAAVAAERAAGCGLALPLRARRGSVRVRCFGGLSLEIGGEEASLDAVRPRARQLLRFLLLHAPRPVHREVLVDALWPHLPPARGASSLHVALTALRHALDDLGGPAIRRDGDAYSIDARSAEIDVVVFRSATGRGADEEALERALELYRGDVFPEEGPAEWVVDERELLREQAVRAAGALAERVASREPRRAAAACERGLELDRHSDGLWSMLVDAYEAAGNPAAARRAAERYDEVLRRLGVPLGAR